MAELALLCEPMSDATLCLIRTRCLMDWRRPDEAYLAVKKSWRGIGGGRLASAAEKRSRGCPCCVAFASRSPQSLDGMARIPCGCRRCERGLLSGRVRWPFRAMVRWRPRWNSHARFLWRGIRATVGRTVWQGWQLPCFAPSSNVTGVSPKGRWTP